MVERGGKNQPEQLIYSKRLRENKSIATRIKNIFSNEPRDKNLGEGLYLRTDLRNIQDPRLIVRFAQIPDTEEASLLPFKRPYNIDLSFPAYISTFLDNSLCTTPYGELPQVVVGSDNNMYLLSNYYIVTAGGQAVKYEEIIKDESALEIDKAVTQKVGFTPSEEDSRIVPFSENDYEKLSSLLMQIEAGEFEYE